MQRLSGLLLVLAGTAIGAYSYFPPAPDAEQKLAEVTRISAAPDRDTRSAQSPSRSFSPSAPLTGMAQAVGKGTTPAAASIDPNKPVEVPAVTQVKPWTTVVTAESQGRLTSSKPGDDATRLQLTRDLQRELARVGCYSGEVTGSWTPSTKRAMSAFMDRVNATLPVEEPDYILLTLVQGHTATACGATCPSGQSLSNDGRCVPQAVMAQATRKSQREEQRRVAAVEEQRKAVDRKAAQERKVAEERRAADEQKVAMERRAADERKLAGARAKADADRIAAARLASGQAAQAAQDSKRQTLASAQLAEELPWAKQSATQSTAATASPAAVDRPAPPPGMMAIGGPRHETLNAGQSIVALNAEPDLQSGDAVKEPSAAPILNQRPAAATPPQAKLPVQGLPGTKSGPSVQGMPGTKSGPAVQGMAGTKSGPTAHRRAPDRALYRERTTTSPRHSHPPQQYVRRPPPVVVYSAPRPKVYYYASNSGVRSHHRDPSRLAPSHYNMMQSLGGFY